jgi:hypothetical protein
VESKGACEVGQFVVVMVRVEIRPLNDLPLSSMSRLKSLARIV